MSKGVPLALLLYWTETPVVTPKDTQIGALRAKQTGATQAVEFVFNTRPSENFRLPHESAGIPRKQVAAQVPAVDFAFALPLNLIGCHVPSLGHD